MAMEPMTLYSRNADPALVARRLRELVSDAKIDGPDDDWRNAVVKVGSWLKKRSLTIKYSPEYCSEPNWSQQMDGMQGYFARFPDSPAKDIATIIPTSFKIAYSLSFEPDYDPDGDPRLDIVYAIAKAIDGVFFTPSSFRDAEGRVLFCVEGDEYEDPDAEWPKVIASVKLDPSRVSDSGGSDGDEVGEECTSPTADRVARRTLALVALTARAMLEQEESPKNPKGLVKDLLTWIEDVGIHDEIDPDEWEVLQRPYGKVAQQVCAFDLASGGTGRTGLGLGSV